MDVEQGLAVISMDAPNCGFREIANEWIGLSNGCRLAACIWLPDESHSQSVPAILEYLPYHKSGGTELRVRTETATAMTSDSKTFYVDAHLKAYEGDEMIFERHWKEKFRRDLV